MGREVCREQPPTGRYDEQEATRQHTPPRQHLHQAAALKGHWISSAGSVRQEVGFVAAAHAPLDRCSVFASLLL
uniref:Uncharacterized protein n=1 Tax=Knipowitschia caucasica TaxID=637954 RepID=A0AAV2KKT3_KNICA